MFKRFIGVVAMLAILALILFTALGAGTYKSMLPESLFSAAADVDKVELQSEVADVEIAVETELITE